MKNLSTGAVVAALLDSTRLRRTTPADFLFQVQGREKNRRLNREHDDGKNASTSNIYNLTSCLLHIYIVGLIFALNYIFVSFYFYFFFARSNFFPLFSGTYVTLFARIVCTSFSLTRYALLHNKNVLFMYTVRSFPTCGNSISSDTVAKFCFLYTFYFGKKLMCTRETKVSAFVNDVFRRRRDGAGQLFYHFSSTFS